MTKILIVEDDDLLRNAFTTKLSLEGYEVTSAIDGKDALEKAEKEIPDLILLDLLMPVMDGMEFLRQFDVKNKHQETKVIVFSNLNVPTKMQEAVKLGASRYITKATISPNQMVIVIREVLGK